MKTDRSGSDLGTAFQAKASPSPLPVANGDRSGGDLGGSGEGNAWSRFWFAAVPTTGLQYLRLLSGLLFFGWLVSFIGHPVEFFSLTGWLDGEAYIQLQKQLQTQPDLAPVGWSVLYLAGENEQVFYALYWLSVAVLALFTLGIATRITSVLTWVIVVSFLANPGTSYEGDYLLAILAFYTMIGHVLVGQWNGNLSIAARLLGSRDDFLFAGWLFPRTGGERPVSYSANFVMRLLQIHFVIIMLTSALHHTQIPDWWAGVALWYPLHPPFQTTLETLRPELTRPGFTLFYLSVLNYVALAWQFTFPLFAWRRGWWRGLLLGGAAVYWLGVFFIFKLPLFGPFVCIACLSYLTAREWAWIKGVERSWLGSTAKKDAPPAKKLAVAAGNDNVNH